MCCQSEKSLLYCERLRFLPNKKVDIHNGKVISSMRNTRSPRKLEEPGRRARERKKKKNPFAMFVHRFVVSTFWLIVCICLSVASYKITIAYYDSTGGPKNERMTELLDEYFGNDEVIGQISKNLILGQNAKGEIKHIVLGIFNPITGNLDYVTIPIDSQFTISNELYERLCNAGSDAPQIIRLEDADEYFSGTALYGYMVILLEDMLDMDIGYYTVISKKRFEEVFTEKIAGDGQVIYTISQSFLEETNELVDEESLEGFLKTEAESYKSSLSLQGKYKYVPDYLRVTEDCIYTHGLYGVQKADSFEVDVEESRDLLLNIEDNPMPYAKGQEDLEEITAPSSKGYRIEILNASGISGLAALYEKQLLEEGYTVTHIGNYTLGTLTESRIIVRSNGLGKDLLGYIGKANVETSELPEGIDIQILLGTMAKQ